MEPHETGRPLHSLLLRQLRRHGVTADRADLRPLLEAVSAAYHASDDDRRMLERSMDISSEELHEANATSRVSERRFRTLVEQAADAIFLHDLAGRLVDVNARACESLGYGREELLALTMADVEMNLVPHRMPETWRRLVPGRPETLEGAHRRKDGSAFPVEARVGIVGEGPLVLELVRDVSERLRVEADLRAAQRYRLLFESSPQPMFVYFQGSLALAAANEAALAQYGYPTRELLRLSLDDLRDSAPHRRGIQITPAERHRRKNGERFDVETLSHSIVFDDQPARIVLVVDVTERRRARQALATSEHLLSEAQRVAHVGSWVWGAKGTSWSDERYRILGLPPQQSPAGWELLLEHVHPEDRAGFEEAVRRMEAAGGSLDVHHRIVRKDGSVRWVHARARQLDGDDEDRWFGTDQDVTELKQAEEALRRSEARYRTLFSRNLAGVYRSTVEGLLLECNDQFAKIYGWSSAEEMRGLPTVELYLEAGDRDAFLARLRREGSLHGFETQGRRKDGRPIWLIESVAIVSEGGEEILEGTLFDVTDRKALEAQLLQSQKMEAVGRLAGGVAHDFNNFLTAILGCSELLLRGAGLSSTQSGLAETIQRAAQKAAAVTRQLLAFSRRQVMVPRTLDLSEVIGGVEGLLSRMIGEDVKIVSARASGLWPIRADSSHLEQVLVNLAVNARDAMPQGGTLTLSTANVSLSEDEASRIRGLAPGPHVLLTVQDTGCGMTAEVMTHIFEPFFTTKPAGQGTGLGLATVYGVVEQMEGAIEVSSAPGKGTTFRIYLPRCEDAGAAGEASSPGVSRNAPGGSETVLLVEDDELLRGVARRMLEAKGYAVLPARDPAEAIGIFERDGGEIQLLVTDVVLPQMDGLELARMLRKVSPQLRALFVSGYSHSAAGKSIQEDRLPFLQKPFTVDALLKSVREVLDAPEPDA